jgi:hypothetical protein
VASGGQPVRRHSVVSPAWASVWSAVVILEEESWLLANRPSDDPVGIIRVGETSTDSDAVVLWEESAQETGKAVLNVPCVLV